MDEAGEHLLAGSGLAKDQYRGFGSGDLRRAPHRGEHTRVLGDEGVFLGSEAAQDLGDGVDVGRQRQILTRSGGDGGHRRLHIVADAAGHHRRDEPLGEHPADEIGHAAGDVAEHGIEKDRLTQKLERTGVALRPFDLDPARRGIVRRTSDFTFRRAHHQNAHHAIPRSETAAIPQRMRSDLTISVMVTPSRLSSTITTSPRAIRRLLT